jgi:hypothetical protein
MLTSTTHGDVKNTSSLDLEETINNFSWIAALRNHPWSVLNKAFVFE